MKNKINRVNLYNNTKLAVLSNVTFAALSGFAALVTIGGTGVGGYATITNPEVFGSPVYGASFTLFCAAASTISIASLILLLKNTRDVLRYQKEVLKELEDAKEEDEEQIISEYCKTLKNGVLSWNIEE